MDPEFVPGQRVGQVVYELNEGRKVLLAERRGSIISYDEKTVLVVFDGEWRSTVVPKDDVYTVEERKPVGSLPGGFVVRPPTEGDILAFMRYSPPNSKIYTNPFPFQPDEREWSEVVRRCPDDAKVFMGVFEDDFIYWEPHERRTFMVPMDEGSLALWKKVVCLYR